MRYSSQQPGELDGLKISLDVRATSGVARLNVFDARGFEWTVLELTNDGRVLLHEGLPKGIGITIGSTGLVATEKVR